MYAIDYYLKEISGLRELPPNKIEEAIKDKRFKEWLLFSEKIG